jgi:hypothetical protein
MSIPLSPLLSPAFMSHQFQLIETMKNISCATQYDISKHSSHTSEVLLKVHNGSSTCKILLLAN